MERSPDERTRSDDPGPPDATRSDDGASSDHSSSPDDRPQSDDDPPGPSGRRETRLEQLDRNWNEILQELRVTQTGIQILTGFLLTVPFQSRFSELTPDQVTIYLVLVVLATFTTGLMVAPVSLHRWLFRKHAKSTLVAGADRFMRAALVSFSVVVSGVVLLVFDVVVSRQAALVATGALFAFLVVTWFLWPIRTSRRVARRREDED